MLFEAKVRVQALATLFDYGTEDSHGRTYSQKRKAEGLGDYCIGVITRVYATRSNKPQRCTVKWDEGSSTTIEERHLALVGTLLEDTNGDDETTGLSDHMTRDGESTDDDEDGQDEDDASAGTQLPKADAVVTPIGGQVVWCGEYRWRRVKAITNDPRAEFPEFDFTTR
jgi:hypothetical protein